MARPKSTDRPVYLRHAKRNRGYVSIDGKQHWLPGDWNSAESLAAYDRLTGTWLAHGRTMPPTTAEPSGPTVATVLIAFWRHAAAQYVRPDGTPAGELDNFRCALRPLRRLYGATPAAAFGPKALKALRAAMVQLQPVIDPNTNRPAVGTDGEPVTRPGWSRTYANRNIARLQAVFRWAASEELVPAAVADALATVAAIRKGREGARETPPVVPVAADVVERTIPHLSPPVAAMVQIQLLSGARGGELFELRTCDIDRGGPVWKVRCDEHKTAHHDIARTLYFGPRAQEVLTPLLKLDLTAPIFSPADAHAWRNERQAAKRKTPRPPSQDRRAAQTAKRPRPLDAAYSKHTYSKAIARACKRAELPHWHPHQLRHVAGTTYRRECDLETSRILLGHTKDTTTQIYAERDARKVEAAVLRIG